MKIKNIFLKLLVSLLILLTLANFVGSIKLRTNYSYASETTTNELLADNNTGIIGAIINAIKSLILAPFRAARSINYHLAAAGGTVGGVTPGEMTPFDIFFNRFTLLDANIFSTT